MKGLCVSWDNGKRQGVIASDQITFVPNLMAENPTACVTVITIADSDIVLRPINGLLVEGSGFSGPISLSQLQQLS